MLKIDIAEIDLTKTSQYGINWSAVFSKVANLAGGNLSLPFSSPSGALAGMSGATSAAGYASGSSNYSLGVISGASSGAVLQALEEVTNSHLVNQPRITTVSGPSVTINTTKSEPYLAAEEPFIAGGLSSAAINEPIISYVPTGVSLVLTPILHEKKDVVTLYIAPTLNILEGFDTIQYAGSSSGQTLSSSAPIVDSRSLSSIINVKSNTTIIFGGLISNNISREQWKFPMLGDWFPALFSGYNNIKKVTELVFLVTPIVINDTDNNEIRKDQPLTRTLDTARPSSPIYRLTPQDSTPIPAIKPRRDGYDN